MGFVTSCRIQSNIVLQRQQQQQSSSSFVSSSTKYQVDCIRLQKSMTQRKPLLFSCNHQARSFATRRKRHQPNYNKSKSSEYWDNEYIKSKEHFDSINKNKLQLEEPRQLNDILSWRVLLIMAVSPLVLCLIIPDIRNQMLDAFDIPTSSTSAPSSLEESHPNKK